MKPELVSRCALLSRSIRPRRRVPPSTHPGSNNIAIFTAEEEPTEDTLSFLYVPYTRHVAGDEAIELNVAELVRPRSDALAVEKSVTSGFRAPTHGLRQHEGSRSHCARTEITRRDGVGRNRHENVRYVAGNVAVSTICSRCCFAWPSALASRGLYREAVSRTPPRR